MPANFVWHKNNRTNPPFAVTTVPTLTVTESGQYFVYVQDNNGCFNYETAAIPVAFTPLPEAPQIDGTPAVCEGDPVVLSIAPAGVLNYKWYRDGVAQPQWDNDIEISDMPSSAGTYVYSAVASIAIVNGQSCNSIPTEFIVVISPLPNVPQIGLNSFQCEPYEVTVNVVNPQSGVSYYWSNGQTGTSASITHDGPIQVRAQLDDCSVTAQTDLPVDLEAVAWIFPEGCYDICSELTLGSITGPLGEYDYWSWNENGSEAVSGTGNVSQFTGLTPGNNYQLYLDNGYCDVTLSDIALQAISCDPCRLELYVVNVAPVTIDDICLYEVELSLTNPNSGPVWVTLTAPGNEGFFVSNTIMMQPGYSTATVQFYPINGFNQGSVIVEMAGAWEDLNCYIQYEIEFPELCFAGRPSGTAPDIKGLPDNMLVVAPNPAAAATTIYYAYADADVNKTIEIFDMLGRKLVHRDISKATGNLVLDVSRLADAQYLIVMKADGETVKSQMLVIKP
jgi:hypothetical protein